MMKSLKAQSKAGAASRLARMSKYAKGGKVADGDADDKPVAKAKKAAPMMVDGKPARARLDRPGRKMNRYEGGGVAKQYAFGDPDSGKDLKEKSAAEDAEAAHLLKRGAVKSVVGAAMTGYGRGLGRIPGMLALGDGATDAGDALLRSTKARRMNDEANKAEGRKHGGRAKR